MTGQPSAEERAQWLRLRALHERRAQRALAQAQAELAAAEAAVAARQAQLDAQHRALAALATAWTTAGPDQPRWAPVAIRHHAWLDEWRERHAYALLDDTARRDEAQHNWAACRDRLAAARARHEAVAEQAQALARAARLRAERRILSEGP